MKLLISKETLLSRSIKYKDLVPLECYYCSKTFQKCKHDVRSGLLNPSKNQSCKFCSKNCYIKYKIQKSKNVLTCPVCKKDFFLRSCELRRRRNKNINGNIFCSKTCGNSISSGKRHSKATGAKIRNSLKNKPNLKQNQKHSCPICGNIFMGYNKTCSKKCGYKLTSLSLKKIRNQKEYKKNISDKVKQQYLSGKKKQSGGFVKWINYKNIKVQGTFEYRTCKILDSWKNQGLIKNWNYSPKRIKYIGEDKKLHSYLIDFDIITLENNIIFIEVKGYMKLRDFYKWNCCINQGLLLQVWFLEDIKKYEGGEKPDLNRYIAFCDPQSHVLTN